MTALGPAGKLPPWGGCARSAGSALPRAATATCRGDVALGPLRCTPSRVWQLAIGAGAPRDAVARLLVERDERNPLTWDFVVGDEFHLVINDSDCK